jgi:hypothetical protein
MCPLYLAPYLGQVLLAELSTAHVQAMFTAHQEFGSPVSAATLTRIRATLRAALNGAIRRQVGGGGHDDVVAVWWPQLPGSVRAMVVVVVVGSGSTATVP